MITELCIYWRTTLIVILLFTENYTQTYKSPLGALYQINHHMTFEPKLSHNNTINGHWQLKRHKQ